MLNQSESLYPQGVGEIASAKVRLGNYVNRLLIEITAGTAVDISTDIEWVEVLLNEKSIVPKLTGAELENINKAMGYSIDETMLAINFIDAFALNAGSMYVGGIDTARGVSTFVVNVKIAAGAPADMKIKLWQDEIPPLLNKDKSYRGLDFFRVYSRSVIPAAAAELYETSPIVGATRRNEKLLRLFVSGSNVAWVGVRKNGHSIHDDVPVAINDRDRLDYGGVTVADFYTVDLVKRGDNGEAIDKGLSCKDLAFRIMADGAGNIVQIQDLITNLDNI